jgi:ATP-dependent DNA helicase RecQ
MFKEFDIRDFTLVQQTLGSLGNQSCSELGNSSIAQRLVRALTSSDAEASQLDILVLIRQFLMHVDYWQTPNKCELELPVALVKDFTEWQSIGLVERKLNSRIYVSARAWNPDWLEKISNGVDGDISGEVICRKFSETAVAGDPFLNKFGYDTYRSAGQRSAIRGALSTPPSENLIINLPTGEGKSLIFQLIHSVGFMTKSASKNRGLTLVIVPTIALGTDLEKETSKICGLELPLFYESGNQALRDTFIDKIKSGENCILFASPEAITSQHSMLKLALLEAANNGSIKALVVDEAHLIEAWGTDFRDDFQQLGVLREKLISSAPAGSGLRTIFLSATIAPSAKSTLELIFNKGEKIKSINAGALRAEPMFLKSKVVSKETQIKQVTEAILRAPRPCILYVSTKDDAKFWFSELEALGFNRILIIHEICVGKIIVFSNKNNFTATG